ncbi:MAG: lytic transglycosylase domain-containing protein, partial [Thermodesulfobacteriota bacterium]
TEAQKLAKLIRKECDNYDLDPFLILAIIQVESRFDPIAVSNRGAIGLMQVMPGTADFIAEELGVSINSGKSLYDPLINVKLGIYYFSILLERFETTHDALVAYNVGPTRFSNTKSLQKRTPSYVRKVLSFKNLLEDEKIKTQKS